jgi:hypothetical protein
MGKKYSKFDEIEPHSGSAPEFKLDVDRQFEYGKGRGLNPRLISLTNQVKHKLQFETGIDFGKRRKKNTRSKVRRKCKCK